jgi:hypothetical protein
MDCPSGGFWRIYGIAIVSAKDVTLCNNDSFWCVYTGIADEVNQSIPPAVLPGADDDLVVVSIDKEYTITIGDD